MTAEQSVGQDERGQHGYSTDRTPAARTGQTTPMHELPPPAAGVAHRPAGPQESARANRLWWDGNARDYYDEHGDFLGDADLLWCPEGLREADARLLGDVDGREVLEVGCGAAQGARWLAAQGARVAAFDVSRDAAAGARPGRRSGVAVVRLVQADAQRMPFADGAFDIVASAFGGLPFVDDSAGVARGGPGAPTGRARRLLHDAPDPLGVPGRPRARRADRPPGRTSTGPPTWRSTTPGTPSTSSTTAPSATGCASSSRPDCVLVDLLEPEWPDGHDREWGEWSPLRGRLMPGTAVWVTQKR